MVDQLLIDFSKKKTLKYMKRQINSIHEHHCEDTLYSQHILCELSDLIRSEFLITKQNQYELFIKIDKKRNVKEVLNELRTKVESIIFPDIDIDFLFTFLTISNEIIIRAKR